MPSIRSSSDLLGRNGAGTQRRSISGVHAHFEQAGGEDPEFRVVLAFRSKEGGRFDAILTPLMATGLKSEIARVLEAGQPTSRDRSLEARR